MATKPKIGARPGPAPKPVEQKLRLGNPGGRPLNAKPLVRDISPGSEAPTPTRPLGRHGRDLWDRAWRSASSWLSPTIDTELLQVVCELVDERSALRVTVLTHPADWRSRGALRAIDASLIGGLSLLGFTPADRNRLGVNENQEDDLERRRRERQARSSS